MYKLQVSISIVKEKEAREAEDLCATVSADPVKRDDDVAGKLAGIAEKLMSGQFQIPQFNEPAVVMGVTETFDVPAEDHGALLIILRKYHELGCQFGAPAIDGCPRVTRGPAYPAFGRF